MPVYGFSACSSHTFYLLWKIEEGVSTLRPQLPPQFLADFHSESLSSKDKMQQSLAARIALYYLLKKLDLPIAPLVKNAQGKPMLDGHALHISFAHTRYLAAVALSTDLPIGIDIEVINSRLLAVQERFLTVAEAQDANNCLEKLAIYWCAKEALYKRLDAQSCATWKDMFIEPFQLQAQGKIVAHWGPTKYAMGYQQMVKNLLHPHVLVCCSHK